MAGVAAESAERFGPAEPDPARVEQLLLELALAANDLDQLVRVDAALARQHRLVRVEPLPERGAVPVEISDQRRRSPLTPRR